MCVCVGEGEEVLAFLAEAGPAAGLDLPQQESDSTENSAVFLSGVFSLSSSEGNNDTLSDASRRQSISKHAGRNLPSQGFLKRKRKP